MVLALALALALPEDAGYGTRPATGNAPADVARMPRRCHVLAGLAESPLGGAWLLPLASVAYVATLAVSSGRVGARRVGSAPWSATVVDGRVEPIGSRRARSAVGARGGRGVAPWRRPSRADGSARSGWSARRRHRRRAAAPSRASRRRPGSRRSPPASPIPAVVVLARRLGRGARVRDSAAALHVGSPLAAHPRAWAGVAEGCAAPCSGRDAARRARAPPRARRRRAHAGRRGARRRGRGGRRGRAGSSAWRQASRWRASASARRGARRRAVCLRGDPVRHRAHGAPRAHARPRRRAGARCSARRTAEGRPWRPRAVVVIAGVLALVDRRGGAGARGAAASGARRVARRRVEAPRGAPPHRSRRGGPRGRSWRCARRPAASSPSPELWTFDPMRLVDGRRRGLRARARGGAPRGLVAIAAAEPEAMLRIEVLDALVVRRPDLRPLAQWMDDRARCSPWS